MPTRRQYSGNAVQTTTTGTLSAGGTTVSINSNSGWPSTPAVPFFVVISPGKAIEEKCSATISGTTLTLTRAQDGTSAQSHPAGSQIYPVFTATDADEANRLASAMTTRGDLVTLDSGPNPTRLAVGAANTVLKSNGTDPSYGLIVTANITDANVTTAKIADSNVTTAKINDGAVETAKINDAAVTAAKLNTSTTGTTGQALIANTSAGGGLAWKTTGLIDSQTWSSSTTYTIPTDAQVIVVECIGAGGGGGGGARNTGTSQASGGGGGGGGPYERLALAVSELGGVGASLTVTIADGGTAGNGRTGSTGGGTDGAAGGISRFGSYYFAGGRAGTAGTTGSAGAGGPGYVAPGHLSAAGFGAGGAGSGTATGSSGAKGWRGGAGGAGGGGRAGSNSAGGTGGSFETSPSFSTDAAWTAGTGGGGAAGSAGGGNGTGGSASQGGGGGGSNNAAAGGVGGAGGAPGGGGGGGGGANGDGNGGNGGAGGKAQIKIWVYA